MSQLSIQNDASNVSGYLQPGERIIPSRGRAWRASNFKVFNGLCSSVTSLRLAKEHVSRRAAEEPRCFLLWIQVHLGSQHICKARSGAFRCHTLLTVVLEKPPGNFRVTTISSPLVKPFLRRVHRTRFQHTHMQEGRRDVQSEVRSTTLLSLYGDDSFL